MDKSKNPEGVTGEKVLRPNATAVADILERDLESVIQAWLVRVQAEPELMSIPLN